MKKSIYLFTLLFFISLPLQSKELVIDTGFISKKLGSYLQILEDKEGTLKIEDILSKRIDNRFISCKEEVPNYSFTDSAYWVKINIKSNLKQTKNILFELAFPLMDTIEFYYKDSSGKYRNEKTGYSYPFKSRPVVNNNFLFNTKIDSGEHKTYFFRFKSIDRMEIPLNLWCQVHYYDNNNVTQYIMGAFLGILIFAVFYNLFLLLSIRDKIYIYYILFVLTLGAFQLIQNGYFYQYFWPEILSKYNHYIPQSIALTLISSILISKSYLDTKSYLPRIDRFFNIMMGYFIITLFLPFMVKYSTAIIIQIVGIIITLSSILITVVIAAIGKYRPALFFMSSWSAVMIGGIIYAFKVLGIVPTNFFTNYSLIIGFVIQIIILSLGIADKINLMKHEKDEAQLEALKSQKTTVKNMIQIQKLNKSLEKKIEDLDEANKKIKISEEKYKLLIEGSNEIIFSMDEKWNILTINKAVRKHFNISPDSSTNQYLPDMICDISEDDNISKKLIIEKLEKFSQDRKPINFKADFKTSLNQEPKEMQVNLEYLNIEGKNEILGKASSIMEDSLLKYFQCEKQKFNIGNYLITADEMSHRITRNLGKYVDLKEISLIRIALREIIINAIEHGNLSITFEQKTELIMEDRYFDFIAERQQDREFNQKRVMIEYSISHDKVSYKITDEGSGFNYQKFLENEISINDNMISHGRGLTMAKEIFDEIEFNDIGNQVILTLSLI